jgi:hypothetical protein
MYSIDSQLCLVVNYKNVTIFSVELYAMHQPFKIPQTP